MIKKIFIYKKKILKKIKEFKESYKYVRFYNGNKEVLFVKLNKQTKVRTYLNLIFMLRDSYKEPIVLHFSIMNYIILCKWFKDIDYIYMSKPFITPKIFRSFSHSSTSDFEVSYEYKKIYSKNSFDSNAIPYIMHPQNYFVPEPKLLDKHVGIVISGNFDSKIYNSNVITDNFKILNRWQIYKALLTNTSVVKITGQQFINKYKSDEYLHKLVLMKWQEGAIPSDEWRHYMSSSKFLFCSPGMTMPMCHNVLEAMSVGVVPIINYENWLNPSLINNKNCLVYKSTEDISFVLEKALTMDTIEYNALRVNVLSYFELYYKKYDFEKNRFGKLILLNENIKDLI